MLGFYEDTEYMGWITNRAWWECIRCKAISNIIVDVEGTGVGIYAADSAEVIHNTMFNVGQGLMAPVIINAVQHWENNSATGSPIKASSRPRIFNNIMLKSKQARAGVSAPVNDSKFQEETEEGERGRRCLSVKRWQDG